MAKKRRWWQGLFARVTLAYTVGAILLSTIVAVFSFTAAQTRLLAETERVALEQFQRNGETIRTQLRLEGNSEVTGEERKDTFARIFRLTRPSGNTTRTLVVPGLDPFGPLSEREIPSTLKAAIIQPDERLAKQRYSSADGTETFIAFAVRLEDLEGLDDLEVKYYETVPLSDLELTLDELRRVLLVAAIAASLSGTALGYYSARRALAPVTRISSAAREIAAGNFTTRLDLESDPDLQVLSSSFNDMVDALSRRIDRDARFASDVSHELRSPLMTLTASVEVLERRKASLPEVAQTAVGLLRQDLTRFVRLVEDLLEISRLDAGAVQLQLGRVQLAEFLANVIAQSRSPEIELQHADRDRGLVISADKRRLAQVVSNLVDNARKYGGGATGISYRRVGEQVQIIVEDGGAGVRLEDRKRIFDRFSRAGHDAGRRGVDTGVGLGLSLVAEHTRLHGGRVWVTDRVDGSSGARFVVELPLGEFETVDEEMAV